MKYDMCLAASLSASVCNKYTFMFTLTMDETMARFSHTHILADVGTEY